MPPPKTSAAYVQPGDVLDLVVQLRRLASEYESLAFLICGSFDQFGLEVEAAAAASRPVVQSAADRLYDLLELLEKTPAYRSRE